MPDGVHGNYTGANCSPAKRKAIKEGILSCQPVQAIAKAVHATTQTVMVVRDQEVPDWRKEQSSNLKELARDMVHHFRTADLDTIPWTVKPVMYGIIMDKIANLDGEPSQIVEHRHSVDVQTLRSSLSLHEEIDVTPSNHGYALDTGHENPLIPEQTPDSQ